MEHLLSSKLCERAIGGIVNERPLRWKTINGAVIDGGILNCFIQYQSKRTGWGQRTLRRQAGSSTIKLAAFTLEWSYSTKRAVWIYLPPDVQYALKTDEQGMHASCGKHVYQW